MEIVSANIPKTLLEAIGLFLQRDYSHEEITHAYSEARKQAHRIHVKFSGLLGIPANVIDPLDGLQSIRTWCIEARTTVDEIATRMDQGTLIEVITQFGQLKDWATEIHSLVNNEQREKIINEINAELEKKCTLLKEQKSKLAAKNKSPLLIQSEIAYEIELEALHKKREAVSIYLSHDPDFQNRLSGLDEEIFKVIERINNLIGDNTPLGKSLDLYCQLNDISLQLYLNDVSYSFQNLQDIIFDHCSQIYEAIDNAAGVFRDIQSKIEQKGLDSKSVDTAKTNHDELDYKIIELYQLAEQLSQEKGKKIRPPGGEKIAQIAYDKHLTPQKMSKEAINKRIRKLRADGLIAPKPAREQTQSNDQLSDNTGTHKMKF